MVDRIIQALIENGYFTQDQILSENILKSINHYFEDCRPLFMAAKVGSKDQKERIESIRGDFSFWLDPLAPPIEFQEVFNFLNELKGKINQELFLGLKQYECHLAYYPEGTFYKKHLDTFHLDSSRKLSFIFYLNQEWSDSDGGELLIYGEDGEILTSIAPRPGRFVCFLSSKFPHEVKVAKKERRSFTGWMHSKILY